MASLRERFEAARRAPLLLGKHAVTIRRPTAWEVCELQRPGRVADLAWAAGFVVGWNLLESDLLPGGDPEPAEFDPVVFLGWIKDKPEHWPTLIGGVIGAFKDHRDAEEARGNV